MTAGLISPGALFALPDPPPVFRVIGLDLSLTSTGVALPDGSTLRIRTRQADGDRRLLVIRDRIRALLAEHRPDLAVIEDMPAKLQAHAAKAIGFVHGVARGELLEADVPYAVVAPGTLKAYAADNGRATKQTLAAAAYLAAGVEFGDDPKGDQCDAWWLRAAGHDAYGAPLFRLPQAQRDRLLKVAWPNFYRQRYALGMGVAR